MGGPWIFDGHCVCENWCPAGQEGRCRPREHTVDTVRGGEAGMNEERSMETYSLAYVKQAVGIC